MVAGLEDISTGELRIGGRRVNEIDPQDRDIAMVFQSYALYPHMTVADNIAYGLKLRKMPKDEMNARIKKAADMLELDAPPGPQAQAALRRPAPARGHGPRDRARAPGVPHGRAAVQPRREAARADARRDLGGRAPLNTTTLYVTHDQTEAMTMGDRMAVMKAGILQQLGTPGECYDTPDNLFVAQFVGSPPMNLVMGSISQGPDGLHLEIGGSSLEIPASVLETRPALRSYIGKPVAVGVRSEDMEDAALANAPVERRIKGKVSLTEALGSEIIVHFTVPRRAGRHRRHQAPGQGGRRRRGDPHPRRGRREVRCSFAPRSRVRRGDEIEISVDVERVHYFDPENSQAIRG